MSSCGFNFKIWSLLQQQVSDKNLSFTSYHDKETKDSIPVSDIGVKKRDFLLSRKQTWTPRNKRPNKLREQLKILEATFQSNAVIKFEWKNQRSLKIIFNNALIVDIEISSTNDISKIRFNKTLVGKFLSSTITSAGVGDHFSCMTFLQSSQVAFITGKSETKPFVKEIPVPGPITKELKRKICVNASGNLVICWWKFGSQLQNIPETDQVNIVLIDASNNRFDVVSSLLTEEDLFDLQFSKTEPNKVLTLERPLGKTSSLNSVIYEINNFKMSRLKVTTLSLRSGVLSAARNNDDSKLLVGCSDGKLLLYDVIHGGEVMSSVARAPCVPNRLLWCEDCVVVASGRGELVMYDTALNPATFTDLHDHQYTQLKLYEYLSSGNGLADIHVCPSGGNQLLIFFNGGPLVTLHLYGRLDNATFIRQYLDDGKAREAIDVLRTIDWNLHETEAFHGLVSIADELLKEPLAHDTEEFLEQTFATFYSSRRPIDDHIVLKHRLTLGCYLRRFFHHLLHYMRFEKAFLLAKDISASELFTDIYFAASDVGEIDLARIAKRKADELAAQENAENGLAEEDGNSQVFEKLNFHHEPKDDVDHLEIALRRQLNTATSKGKSTLKVMNLGYV